MFKHGKLIWINILCLSNVILNTKEDVFPLNSNYKEPANHENVFQ